MAAIGPWHTVRAPDLSVRSYAKFVARHRWIIAAFVIVGLAVGLAFAARQPLEFAAVSRVVLTPQESVASTEVNPNVLHLVSLDSDAQLLSSTSVLAAAAAALDWPATAGKLEAGLNVSAVPNSRVLIVRYSNAVADRSITGCDAIVGAFLRARAAAAQERSAAARGVLEQQIADLSERLIALHTSDAALGGGVILADRTQEIELNDQLEGLRTSLTHLPTEAVDPEVVVSPARQHGDGARPMAGATLASGALLGLIGGLLGGQIADQRAFGLHRRRISVA